MDLNKLFMAVYQPRMNLTYSIHNYGWMVYLKNENPKATKRRTGQELAPGEPASSGGYCYPGCPSAFASIPRLAGRRRRPGPAEGMLTQTAGGPRGAGRGTGQSLRQGTPRPAPRRWDAPGPAAAARARPAAPRKGSRSCQAAARHKSPACPPAAAAAAPGAASFPPAAGTPSGRLAPLPFSRSRETSPRR